MIGVLATSLLLWPCITAAANEDKCPPHTWADDKAPNPPADTKVVTKPAFLKEEYKAGEVNCRGLGFTGKRVDSNTCKEVADEDGITLERFFLLNPTLDRACTNIEPNSIYCTDGFIEPVRAYDGRCGPPNNDATCMWVDDEKPCCNSETWTCGGSEEDCAPGICYEGECPGHKVYTTDGKCGVQNGNCQCAGKWGDCCSVDGECGTGPDFCGDGVCSFGNCVNPPRPPYEELRISHLMPWQSGNTPDGSCGGEEGYTCWTLVYGGCCNKEGKCGSDLADCLLENGCQPEYGACLARDAIPADTYRLRMESEQAVLGIQRDNGAEMLVNHYRGTR